MWQMTQTLLSQIWEITAFFHPISVYLLPNGYIYINTQAKHLSECFDLFKGEKCFVTCHTRHCLSSPTIGRFSKKIEQKLSHNMQIMIEHTFVLQMNTQLELYKQMCNLGTICHLLTWAQIYILN